MAGKGGKKDLKRGVIIKRYTIEGGSHHGGAWKVAYADFVTAMMAFFLLMWLLNATTEDQRKGLADYFSPNNVMSHASSGTGEPFGGHTAFDQGALVSDRGAVQVTVGNRPVLENVADGDDPISTEFHRARSGDGTGKGPAADDQDADDQPPAATVGQAGATRPPGQGGAADPVSQGHAKLNRDMTADDDAKHMQHDQMRPDRVGRDGARADAQAEAAQQKEARQEETRQQQAVALRAEQEKAAFEQAAEQIGQAVRADPALADLARQLAVDITPQGLRIQIMDEVKLPMFPTGSATPNERARLLIQKVVPVLMKLRHPISIAGHTDAQPFPGPDRTNWELSAERANATRRLLTDGGLPETDIQSVSGHADHDPLLPADPMAAANRRIAIMVLREAPLPTAAPPPAPSPPAAPPRESAVQPSGSAYSQPSDAPGRPGRQSAQAPAQPNQEPARGSGRPAPLFGTTRTASGSVPATYAAPPAPVTASPGVTPPGATYNVGAGAPADAATEAAGPATLGR